MRSPLTPWCGFLVVCVLCSLAPPMAVPQDVDRLGPINPEHVAYRDSVAAGTWSPVSPTGRGLGHIPPLFLTDPNLPPGRHIVGAYPDDYVLPAADLPSIRNQGACGSCWAFATYGSMETCGLVASDDGTDWSENHLKNNHGWDYTCCYGGHCFMSAAYFSRWDGPITEADDPYSTSCTGSSGTVQKHLESMWCLPTDDPSAIKDAIYQYGGVYTSYYNPGTGAYYNGTFTAYYYPPTGPQEVTSHAVTIVGWDDGYKRANFATDPGVDGAWFVRNSWGTFNSLGGYEWVSYNDKFMGKSLNALFLEPEATDNLAYCYEYDPLGEVVKWGSSTTGSYRWMANIFPRVAVGGQDRQDAGPQLQRHPDLRRLSHHISRPAGGHPRRGYPFLGHHQGRHRCVSVRSRVLLPRRRQWSDGLGRPELLRGLRRHVLDRFDEHLCQHELLHQGLRLPGSLAGTSLRLPRPGRARQRPCDVEDGQRGGDSRLHRGQIGTARGPLRADRRTSGSGRGPARPGHAVRVH
jgi:hypothetical protein